ncbi:MAG: hypothetical protein ABIP81_02340 [Terriglobales bacterium]
MMNNPVKEVVVVNDSGGVNPPHGTIILSRAAGDRVLWVSQCDQLARIVFAANEGSPFEERIYDLPAHGTKESGPLSGAALATGSVKVYKYSVMGSIANNDPIIIVND